MGFFEPPPPPEGDELDHGTGPPWWGPPHSVLGASVPFEPLLLVATDRVAVAVVAVTAYPTGFECSLSARLNLASGSADDFFQLHRLQHGVGYGALPDEFLRFGVQFADGRKATNVDPHPGLDEEPTGPVLTQHGGGGSSAAWHQSYWVWPLPPPGALAFVCEWPALGVPLTRTEIDAELVSRAAEHAIRLWTDEEPGRRRVGLDGSFG